MKTAEHETYLGDVICSSGKNEENISNKANYGVGAISQIFSMLSQVSLGHFGLSGVRALPLGCRHKRSGHSNWHYFSTRKRAALRKNEVQTKEWSM